MLVVLLVAGCYVGVDEHEDVDLRSGFEIADLVDTDRFGVGMVYETLDRTWFAKWDEHPRTLSAGQTDPYDAEFHNLGHGNTFNDPRRTAPRPPVGT